MYRTDRKKQVKVEANRSEFSGSSYKFPERREGRYKIGNDYYYYDPEETKVFGEKAPHSRPEIKPMNNAKLGPKFKKIGNTYIPESDDGNLLELTSNEANRVIMGKVGSKGDFATRYAAGINHDKMEAKKADEARYNPYVTQGQIKPEGFMFGIPRKQNFKNNMSNVNGKDKEKEQLDNLLKALKINVNPIV